MNTGQPSYQEDLRQDVETILRDLGLSFKIQVPEATDRIMQLIAQHQQPKPKQEKRLPSLDVIEIIDSWIHKQTHFHLPDMDGYREMLDEVAKSIEHTEPKQNQAVTDDERKLREEIKRSVEWVDHLSGEIDRAHTFNQTKLLQHRLDIAKSYTSGLMRAQHFVTMFARQPEAKVAEARSDVIAKIYGIANDLANKDPKAIGSVSLAPYFANAVAIYQEYLKGDDYERIDWKSLSLPTLNLTIKETK